VTWTLRLVGTVAIIVVLSPERTFGQGGGPPLITDDPDTPGPGYWEINIANLLERSRSERRIEQPLVDINYGVGQRIQLKFEIPWLRVRDGERSVETGLGNALSGVKWRFLGQEGQRLAWSIYPQLEVDPSKSLSDRELVTNGPEFFFPTELTFQVRSFELNGEVGRSFVRHERDTWAYGLSTEVETHLGLELLCELHVEHGEHLPAESIVDVGVRQNLTRQITLLAAVGTAVHGSPQERLRLRLYVGMQFNLPSRFVFSPFRNGSP